ncbi:MAG: hypothetical protein R3C40_07130 [Parvularculaceae bacterium]
MFPVQLSVNNPGGLTPGTPPASAGAGSDFAYFAARGPGDNKPGLDTCTTLNRAAPYAYRDDNVAPNEFVRVDFVDRPFDVFSMSFNGQENNANVNLGNSSGLIKIDSQSGRRRFDVYHDFRTGG